MMFTVQLQDKGIQQHLARVGDWVDSGLLTTGVIKWIGVGAAEVEWAAGGRNMIEYAQLEPIPLGQRPRLSPGPPPGALYWKVKDRPPAQGDKVVYHKGAGEITGILKNTVRVMWGGPGGIECLYRKAIFHRTDNREVTWRLGHE